MIVTLRTPDIKLSELQALASEIRARWQAVGIPESREKITEDDQRLHKILAPTGWLDSPQEKRVPDGFWTGVLKQWTNAGWRQVTRQALMMRARRLKEKISQVPLDTVRRQEDDPRVDFVP